MPFFFSNTKSLNHGMKPPGFYKKPGFSFFATCRGCPLAPCFSLPRAKMQCKLKID